MGQTAFVQNENSIWFKSSCVDKPGTSSDTKKKLNEQLFLPVAGLCSNFEQ